MVLIGSYFEFMLKLTHEMLYNAKLQKIGDFKPMSPMLFQFLSQKSGREDYFMTRCSACNQEFGV